MLSSLYCCLLLLCATAGAQDVMSAHTLLQEVQQHAGSGTSVEPASTPVPMLMRQRGAWQLMLHGEGFLSDTQQQALSPRNRDAFFSTNWIMPMAQRAAGQRGEFTFRAMISLEPATIRGGVYPELFQQGETAHGAPIVDGQHPHDFVMELAAMYDLKLSRNMLFSLYAAPVGDPAIGPTAYPHRLSASEDPIAALGHHQQDSTHIAFNVLTGGLSYRWMRVELSGFHGAEPTEARWHLQPSPNGRAIDSVATRLTISPTSDWTGQYSIAHITSPEALYPGEDQQRQTASVMYHHTFRSRPMPSAMAGMGMDMTADKKGMPGMHMDAGQKSPMHMSPEPATDLAATVVWGRTRSIADNSKANSYLAEVRLRFATRNYVWTRMENAARTNELLLNPGSRLPAGFREEPIGHVAAYSFGYDHDFALFPHLLATPGVQVTVYRTPDTLRSPYGATPTSEQIFVRFRVR